MERKSNKNKSNIEKKRQTNQNPMTEKKLCYLKFRDISRNIGEIDTIADNAFSECNKLHTVNIQKINNSIKSNAFSKCTNLKNITYNGKNIMNLAENEKFKGICVVDDSFFIKYDEIIQNDNGEITTIEHMLPIEVDMPIEYGHEESINKPITLIGNIDFSKNIISDGMLRGCQTITGINLKNVEEIGNNAFDRCSNLAHVEFSPSLNKIGKCAFQDSGIESIDLSNTRYYSYSRKSISCL